MRRKISVFLFLSGLGVLFFGAAYGAGRPDLAPGDHYAEINTYRLHYTVRGNGPVCLVPSPGWGASVDYLIPLKVLEEHFTVVYYDTRGSGLSEAPPTFKGYADGDFISDLDALRLFLNRKQVWLAGHSAGGYIVLNYAVHHPAQVSGIISIDAISGIDQAYERSAQKIMADRKNAPYYLRHPDEYQQAVAALNGQDTSIHDLKGYLDRIFKFYYHDPEKIKPLNATLSDSVFRFTGMNRFFQRSLLGELGRITSPVLVISGDDDFICDADSQARRIQRNIPGSRLAIIRDCGHLPFDEQPAAFRQACERFFKDMHL